MKAVLSFLIAACVGAASGWAQVDTVRVLTDGDEASAYADSAGVDVLAVFAGSDWCRPCKMFERAVLEAPEFREGAAGEVAVLYLDFPAKRRNALPPAQTAHNEAMAKRFNPTGSFPKLLLLRADQTVLAGLEYAGQDAPTFLAELRAARAGERSGR